jgi:hypothetical protein
MRDHPYHKIPAGTNQMGILAGMWGIKNNVIPITDMIKNSNKSKEHRYGSDQAFLKNVYNILINDRCTHDEFFEQKPFPIIREGRRFIGERIDENDKPLTDDYNLIS